MTNIEPIEVNIFCVLSVFDGGGYPSTNDEMIADFSADFAGLPVVPGVLGYVTPILAPYLEEQFPWLRVAIASLPAQEQYGQEERVIVEDADGPVENDSFAGYVRYMNVVYAALQKIVDEHGDRLFVQPLTDEQREQVRMSILAVDPRR